MVNDRVLIPAGTYIQGKISHVVHAGRIERPGGTAACIYFDDLSQRLYGDAARFRGEHAGCRRQGREG